LLEPRITKGKLDRVRLYESPDLFADCMAAEPAEPAAVQKEADRKAQEAGRRAWRDR
jgi:hypothetical protein